jgi:hypothetical protein
MRSEEPRGRRMSMPAQGLDTIKDGVWTSTHFAYCACGKTYTAERTFVDGGPEEDRLIAVRASRDDVQDQWWECFKTHEFDAEGNMTKGNPKWEQFEHSVQELLDLRSTPGSGNQWHDPSDGRSRSDDPYKIMVDCKHTEAKSCSLNGAVLQGWWDRATGLGYHFALPVHMEGMEGRQKEWVAIPLDDYAELVDKIRRTSSGQG